MAKSKQGVWEVIGEQLVVDKERWGYTDHVRTEGEADWDWVAEGGPLGPVEGRARTAEQARELVEVALGLRPMSPLVKVAARRTARAERLRGGR